MLRAVRRNEWRNYKQKEHPVWADFRLHGTSTKFAWDDVSILENTRKLKTGKQYSYKGKR